MIQLCGSAEKERGTKMIAFDKFIIDDSGPIYAQIVRYVKRGIVAGNIGNGEEMPRETSSFLAFGCESQYDSEGISDPGR